MALEAKYMSKEAKAACKALHMTPKFWEPLNSNRSGNWTGEGDPVYPVMRVWNSKREVILTNEDLAYAWRYLI